MFPLETRYGPLFKSDSLTGWRYIDFEVSVDRLHLERLEAVLPTGVGENEIRENYHPERQIGRKDGGADIDVTNALSLANAVLHDEGSTNDHVSSSSKLLHFSSPGLFPILDHNICRLLFRSENLTARHYHAYVCLIHDQLAQSPFSLLRGHTDWLKKVWSTPVRVFENFLFHRSS